MTGTGTNLRINQQFLVMLSLNNINVRAYIPHVEDGTFFDLMGSFSINRGNPTGIF